MASGSAPARIAGARPPARRPATSAAAPQRVAATRMRQALTAPLLLVALLLAALAGPAAARELLSANATRGLLDDGWTYGRTTYYGTDAWTIHKGSCGFGYIPRSSITGWDVAALAEKNPDFGNGGCGRCYEVQCRGAAVKDKDAPSGELDRYAACGGTAGAGKSVVVRVVDRCDCYYPPNMASNARWCCGDMPHMDLSFWAFEKLASPSWGVIGARWRPVACAASDAARPAGAPAPGLGVLLDEQAQSTWLALRVVNANWPVKMVEVQDSAQNSTWHAMKNPWGASWALSAQDAGLATTGLTPPLSLRVTSKDGQTLELDDVITQLSGSAQFMTDQQFAPTAGVRV